MQEPATAEGAPAQDSLPPSIDPPPARAAPNQQWRSAYEWGPGPESIRLEDRVPPPPGFRRIELAAEGFGAWLRGLPTKPGRPRVLLHDGRRKLNQSAHHLVIDMDTGPRDLQQCADAVIRLRAECLRAAGRGDDICFRFTSGDEARWTAWREGERPVVRGNQVTWVRSAASDSSHQSFRRYLDQVFVYAGSWSLERELRAVDDPRNAAPGDVLIRGGFPGHAVMVLDAAEHPDGRRVVLLGQSFMPAQDFHVLVNPGSRTSPWYETASRGPVQTPEWRFDWSDLARFAEQGCPPLGAASPRGRAAGRRYLP
ncbi:MAG: DUF4846 domain-containing protein [Myxococcota bacterium]